MSKLSPASRYFPDGIATYVRGMAGGQHQAQVVTSDCLEWIAARDQQLRCMVYIDSVGALSRARELDEWLAAGKPPLPLHGVPIVIKEIYSVTGMPDSSGSRLATPHLFTEEGPIVQRLRAAGCVLLGKSFSTEFAFGQLNLGRHLPVNPRALDATGDIRVTGGSSSGSVAAQSAGYCGFSLGTDTGGSVRAPAALCGVVGFKPSEGRLSTAGIFPLCAQLDTPGLFTASVADAALVYSVLAGDESVLTASTAPGPIRLGIPKGALVTTVSADVAHGWRKALTALQAGGITLVELDMPPADDAARYFARALPRELLANLGEDLVVRNISSLDPVTRVRLEPFLAGEVGPPQTIALDEIRAAAGAALEAQALQGWLLPTVPCVAPLLTDLTTPDMVLELQTYLSRNTRYTSLLGHAAINLPLPPELGGPLPIGLQLAAPQQADARLLALAARLEATMAG